MENYFLVKGITGKSQQQDIQVILSYSIFCIFKLSLNRSEHGVYSFLVIDGGKLWLVQTFSSIK